MSESKKVGRQSLSEDPNEEIFETIPYSEVEKHNSTNDCWIIIKNKVYDLTTFAEEHPGGSDLIYDQAGKDASEDFLDAHPEDIMLLTLGRKGLANCFKGHLNMDTVPILPNKLKKKKKSAHDKLVAIDNTEIPSLDAVLNLHDFAAIAQRVMINNSKKQAWDYYSSGADDELTYNENVNAYQRIWLKPRILVNVKEVSMDCNLLGHDSSFPVYLSSVAMCGLGHADGECSWVKAAHAENVVFMVPCLSSKSFKDITAARAPDQKLWFQLYVNPDREIVIDQLSACEQAGVTTLCITVDSACVGKRERDLRNKIAIKLRKAKVEQATAKSTKARKAGTYANRDPSLCWDDIKWFKQNTTMNIVIKGVQCGEDAVMAVKAGCQGIILSNHGGRNLDTSRSGIEILPEVMAALRQEGMEKKIQVFIDGGIRRGSDILKAIALGATAVGLGKPAVFAMSSYGEDGIQRMLQILKDELRRCMMLIGARSLEELTPRMVNADALNKHTESIPIPPSPYVTIPPPKNVRSPTFPEENREKLEQQIKELQAKLDTIDDRRIRYALPPSIINFVRLSWVMLKSIGKTVISRTLGGTLHRSALFLITFLGIHVCCNLCVFLGPETFNLFGHQLSSSWFIKGLECYLAVAGILHAGIGMFFSWRRRKFITKAPINNGKLFISSILVLVFIIIHLKTFRFSSWTDDYIVTSTDGTKMKNFYKMEIEVFKNPLEVGFYIISIIALGIHLWYGWSKAVLKMGIPKNDRQAFINIGHVLIWPICFAFIVCVIYMWYVGLHRNVSGSHKSEL